MTASLAVTAVARRRDDGVGLVRLAERPGACRAVASCSAASRSSSAGGRRLDRRSTPPRRAAFRLAGCLLLPLAVLAYPRLAWRDPVSFVLLVVVVAAGVLGVAWAEYARADGLRPRRRAPRPRVVGASSGGTPRTAARWRGASLAWIGGRAGRPPSWGSSASRSARASVTDLDAVFVAGPRRRAGRDGRRRGAPRGGRRTRSGDAGRRRGDRPDRRTSSVGGRAHVRPSRSSRASRWRPTPMVVLCALLAFGVRPLQVLLRGVVDQLLFGDRPDPLAAATSLADRIGDDPALALAAVREALVLPYASIRAGGEVLASSGTEVTHTRVAAAAARRGRGRRGGRRAAGGRPRAVVAPTRTCCASWRRCWPRRCARGR